MHVIGETARELGIDLAKTSISHVIVAGEPGGSIPATRQAIEDLWGAKCYELYGIAELGPTNPGCPLREGVHLCEEWYHALVVDEESGLSGARLSALSVLVRATVEQPQPINVNRASTPCTP